MMLAFLLMKIQTLDSSIQNQQQGKESYITNNNVFPQKMV